MSSSKRIYIPVPAASDAPQLSRQPLDALSGKTVGFIDNAKPNFNYLVDDLGDLLVRKYGVAAIVKHRKPGQVPAGDAVIDKLAEQCDAVITGSGD